MLIRDAKPFDLPRIVEIYNASIPDRLATADTTAVSIDSRREWFAAHDPHRYALWVLEHGNHVVAWLSFGVFYGRPAYAATTELSLYVAPEAQRRGFARTLLQQAIAQAPTLGFHTLLGFIFGHNHPSLRLFSLHEFTQWARLPCIANLDGIERDLIILGRRLGQNSCDP
jgi:L-amino acid N-acyltransferase YncA